MNISAYRADYLPLMGQLMNQMQLTQIINEVMAIPKSQAIVDADNDFRHDPESFIRFQNKAVSHVSIF
jgi:hypothetical protein